MPFHGGVNFVSVFTSFFVALTKGTYLTWQVRPIYFSRRVAKRVDLSQLVLLYRAAPRVKAQKRRFAFPDVAEVLAVRRMGRDSFCNE